MCILQSQVQHHLYQLGSLRFFLTGMITELNYILDNFIMIAS